MATGFAVPAGVCALLISFVAIGLATASSLAAPSADAETLYFMLEFSGQCNTADPYHCTWKASTETIHTVIDTTGNVYTNVTGSKGAVGMIDFYGTKTTGGHTEAGNATFGVPGSMPDGLAFSGLASSDNGLGGRGGSFIFVVNYDILPEGSTGAFAGAQGFMSVTGYVANGTMDPMTVDALVTVQAFLPPGQATTTAPLDQNAGDLEN